MMNLFECVHKTRGRPPGTKLKREEDIANYTQENLSLQFVTTLGLLEEMLKYIYITCELKELESHCLEAQKEFSKLIENSKLKKK